MHASSRTDLTVQARLCPVKKAYEAGMKISYAAKTQRVIVAFRGRITVLPDTYESEEKGISAGENHCRCLGWNPNEHGKKMRSLF